MAVPLGVFQGRIIRFLVGSPVFCTRAYHLSFLLSSGRIGHYRGFQPAFQAGLNPARDMSPRLFALLAGWGGAACPGRHYGFVTLYVLGPVCGAAVAACMFTYVIEPLMKEKGKEHDSCGCV